MSALTLNTVTRSRIKCCVCGADMEANSANTCITCIKKEVDITEPISKDNEIHWCRSCERWLNPPAQWVKAEWESKELLQIALKKVRGLQGLKMIDAGFVWTEPHSRRIKVKLVLQKEAYEGIILEQTAVVNFIQANQFCPECHLSEAKLTWGAIVQIRQKTKQKRFLLYLEQVILKARAHLDSVNIKERADGLDFYFMSKSLASKFVSFLGSVAPVMSVKKSERLISADVKSNKTTTKYSFSVELVPLNRDDLLCLPRELQHSVGMRGQVVLVDHISRVTRLLDPTTLEVGDLQASSVSKLGVRAIATSPLLTKFVVLDIEPEEVYVGRYRLAEVTVAKESDLGANDTTYTVKTHLGNLLDAGDVALGYLLASSNYNDDILDSVKGPVPEVVLVRKVFEESQKKKKRPAQRLGRSKEPNPAGRNKSLLEADEEVAADDIDELEQEQLPDYQQVHAEEDD